LILISIVLLVEVADKNVSHSIEWPMNSSNLPESNIGKRIRILSSAQFHQATLLQSIYLLARERLGNQVVKISERTRICPSSGMTGSTMFR
jgi:hypothetical protein